MAEHQATIEWRNSGEDFLKGCYSREHTWSSDGGMTIAASPSPSVVPPLLSNPAYINPEEAFVAALSSCHMHTFLYVAQRAGFAVAHDKDTAVGRMGKNAKGIPWFEEVIFRPSVIYEYEPPSHEQEGELHERAHEHCFIANSVSTKVTAERVGT